MRTGRLDITEQNYIERNCDIMSYDEIAKKLQRRPQTIKNYIQHKLGKHLNTEKDRLKVEKFNLQESPLFENIKKQFTPKEIEVFNYHYALICSQFQDDIMPTERLQIIDCCKMELLIDRTLIEQMDNRKFVEELKTEMEAAKAAQDGARVGRLTDQLSFARAAQDSIDKNFKDLVGRKDSMLKALKATRRDRYEKHEQSKTSFATWLTELWSDLDKRRQIGKEMEMNRLAAEREYERLGGYIQFADGEVDRPILNSETVKREG